MSISGAALMAAAAAAQPAAPTTIFLSDAKKHSV